MNMFLLKKDRISKLKEEISSLELNLILIV